MKDLIIQAIIQQAYTPTEDEFRIIEGYKIKNTTKRLEWFLKQLEKARRAANAKPWSPTPVKRQLKSFSRAACERRLAADDY